MERSRSSEKKKQIKKKEEIQFFKFKSLLDCFAHKKVEILIFSKHG